MGLKVRKGNGLFWEYSRWKNLYGCRCFNRRFHRLYVTNGAVKVYSVDVGHGQLAWKLVQDERVICMDRTNIRYVTPEDIDDVIDFASIDVSFISLTKVLLPVKNLLTENGQIICLIKPQFEAGRENVGKKGVVRDKKVHKDVIESVITFAMSIGFDIINLDFSPVKGPEGNIEYLLYLQNTNKEQGEKLSDIIPEEVVENHIRNWINRDYMKKVLRYNK